MIFLSLDAKKAFDHLSWPFLFATLEHEGITGCYLNAIKVFYSNPSAVIKLPHVTSNQFSIFNGTRQCCPTIFSSFCAVYCTFGGRC